MKRKRVVVLGATGSIGESAAKVARDIPERVEIVGIAANSKARELAAQANELRPAAVCIVDETKLSELRANLKYEPEIFAGETGLREIASTVASDMVLVAIVGTGGLRPALAAIEAGKDLAVASKEILVMAGEIVMRKAREKGVQVLPVDSEHNAIFQCLKERPRATVQRQRSTSTSNAKPALGVGCSVFRFDVRRIILTASGGPFRNTSRRVFQLQNKR
jgi:1-deoxy-D-xylulose-5-phosphate reductoisomerase